MARINAKFGPKNEAEQLVFAAEGLRVDVQVDIQKVMRSKGIGKKKLRRRAGLTKKQVKRLFDDRRDIGVKVLARVYHALGMRCRIVWHPRLALPRHVEGPTEKPYG